MAVKIELHRNAVKDLRAIPKKKADAILAALEEIAEDPFAKHGNVERIRGRKDIFRLRAGDIRAVYMVDREKRTLTVQLVKSRGDAYR